MVSYLILGTAGGLVAAVGGTTIMAAVAATVTAVVTSVSTLSGLKWTKGGFVRKGFENTNRLQVHINKIHFFYENVYLTYKYVNNNIKNIKVSKLICLS